MPIAPGNTRSFLDSQNGQQHVNSLLFVTLQSD
jgi:hypothetical protein